MKLAGAQVDDAKYEALKELAQRNHRTLADQLRYIYDQALNGRVKIPKASPRPVRTRHGSPARKSA